LIGAGDDSFDGRAAQEVRQHLADSHGAVCQTDDAIQRQQLGDV
jgi:hypothetical protein